MNYFIFLGILIILMLCFMWYAVYKKLMSPYFAGIVTLYLGILVFEINSYDLSTYIKGGSLFGYKSEIKVIYENKTAKTFSSLNSVQNPKDVKVLDCSFNLLTSLQGIEKFTNLEELICHNNLLSSLTGDNEEKILPDSLKRLYCHKNFIVTMFGFGKESQLEELNCSHNFITSLNGIQNCKNLKILDCGVNLIGSIRYLQTLTNLQQIIADGNQIQIVPNFLRNFQHLIHLDLNNNPLETSELLTGENLNEFLEEFNTRKSFRKTIYSDKQNTHDSFIVRAIGGSIENLMKIPVVENSLNLV